MYLSTERAERMVRRTFRHIDRDTTDMADAVVTIDPKIYVDSAVAEAERDNLFYRQPMMAAHASEIAESGTFARVALNRTEVILTRKQDGSVGAFVNACRHRGARLVDEESGRRRLFTCKYHGWTYDNAGALKAITFADSFGARPCAELGLIPLPVEERHGFIWIVEDPAASIDVAAFLGPAMDAAMSRLGLDRFHMYKGEVIELPQNWKVMADGLLDGYHVRFLHGKTIAPYVYHNIMTMDLLTDHAIWGTARKRIDEVRGVPPGEVDVNRYLLFGAFVGPNAQLTLHPHHVEFYTIYQHPDGPHKSRVHLRFLTPEKIEAAAQRDVLDKNYDILLKAVMEEDVPVGNTIQANAAMPQIGEIMLGRNEILNQLFHRSYQKAMRGEQLGGAQNAFPYSADDATAPMPVDEAA